MLLGAGHAHVEVLRRFAMRPEPGVRLTLIGREPETPYSGMLPGLIRGDYTVARRISTWRRSPPPPGPADPGRGDRDRPRPRAPSPCRPAGHAVRPAVDRCRRRAGGAAGRAASPVKPIGRFLERLPGWRPSCPTGARIAVVGGGPAGVELALALAWRFAGALRASRWCPARRSRWRPRPPSARRVGAARRWSTPASSWCRGVTAGALAGRAAGAVGRQLPGGATRAVGDRRGGARRSWPQSGLACDATGCVRVDADAAQRQPSGSCSPPATAPRSRARRGPKAGVWAVRAGAPLARQPAAGGARPAAAALAAAARGAGRSWAWAAGARSPGATGCRVSGDAGLALEGLDRPALDADVHRDAHGARSRTRADALRRLRRQGRRRGAGRRAGRPAACRRRHR